MRVIAYGTGVKWIPHISEINADLHRLRPEYKVKVDKILEDGVFETYSSFDDLKNEIENV